MTTALEGVRGQRHAPAALYPGKHWVPIVQEAVWTPGPVWKGEENLAPTGIRSPDCPARGQSLYRLSYRGFSYIPLLLTNHLLHTASFGLIKRHLTQTAVLTVGTVLGEEPLRLPLDHNCI